MSLFIHLISPVCGTDGSVLHAASGIRNKKVKRKTYDAACGKRVKLLGFPVAGADESYMTVVWPPYVDEARDWGFERCRSCMTASPGKPVHPLFITAPVKVHS